MLIISSLSTPEAPRTQTDTVDVDADLNTTLTLTCRSAGPRAFSTVWLRRGRRLGGETELKINTVQVHNHRRSQNSGDGGDVRPVRAPPLAERFPPKNEN